MARDDAHVFEPASGHGLAHDPFNAIVGPRPIGWISTADPEGRRNLAPYSFFNAFNYFPPIIGFASIGRKDTLANIEATGEFVWNLATDPLGEAMNLTSAPLERGLDEFEIAGLTPVPSQKIKAPRVLESPVNFECRVTQIVQLATLAGTNVETWLVLGEVIAVHLDRAVLTDGVYQAAAAQPILRWGGFGDYARIAPEHIFEMIRPSRRT